MARMVFAVEETADNKCDAGCGLESGQSRLVAYILPVRCGSKLIGVVVGENESEILKMIKQISKETDKA